MKNNITDLERMFYYYEQELNDYSKKTKLDFLLKHESYMKDKIAKDYRFYLSTNEWQELLDYEEWKEEYEEEIEEELDQIIHDFFTEYWIEIYKSIYNYIYDINIAGWWPHIDLRVETKNESVKWIWKWWWEYIEKDLSKFYNIITDLYSLDIIY